MSKMSKQFFKSFLRDSMHKSMVYLFPTWFVSILILLFPDSSEFALEDALDGGKFWIQTGKKILWNKITMTAACACCDMIEKFISAKIIPVLITDWDAFSLILQSDWLLPGNKNKKNEKNLTNVCPNSMSVDLKKIKRCKWYDWWHYSPNHVILLMK